MSQLTLEIKQLIIDALGLEDLGPDDIAADQPLFGEGLGLDSVDALELGLAIQKALRHQDRRRRQGHPQAFRQRRQPGSFRQRQPRHRLRSICREQP